MAGTIPARANLANAIRWHPEDHEAITAARAALKAANVEKVIREAVAAWPPLTDEQRAGLALLLRPGCADAA